MGPSYTDDKDIYQWSTARLSETHGSAKYLKKGSSRSFNSLGMVVEKDPFKRQWFEI